VKSDEQTLHLHDVSKVFGAGHQSVVALGSVNLRVSGNDYVSISGRGGSGRATRVDGTGCAAKPTSGG